MTKVKASEKLIMRGFEYSFDNPDSDESYDEEDILYQLKIDPTLTAKPLSELTKIPVHRVISAIIGLKLSGKLPKIPPPVVVKFPGQEVCSKGNIEPPKRSDSDEPKTNVLFTEPLRLVEPDGQLSIFFDDSEEPPDPDDFKTLEEYHQQHELWSKNHSELAQAMAERTKDIESYKLVLGETALDTSTTKEQFQKGDRIQKLDNPKWIGEIKSITKKGAKIRTPLAYEYMADLAEYRLFSKADSEEILGESFFNIGDRVRTIDSNFIGKVFTVKTIYSTGMIGVVLDNLSCSYPSMCLFHHLEKIESKAKSIPLEQPKVKGKTRPAKGCGSGYLMVRAANVKRNAAKGKDPDVYYCFCYSYTNQYHKEIKSSISVPRAKIAQVKRMVEDKEHYVKIAKFLGKSVPMSY